MTNEETLKLALEALKEPLGFIGSSGLDVKLKEAIKALEEALAKQEQDEPVALVTGVYGGRFTYAPIKASVILPVGMALYTQPQHREWIDLTGEELETLLRKNRSLTLGVIWAVADKLKEKNT